MKDSSDTGGDAGRDAGVAQHGRRGFLTRAGGLAVAAGTGLAAGHAERAQAAQAMHPSADAMQAPTVPFQGAHQAGIVTPQQGYLYFAAFDLATDKRAEVVSLLQDWTAAAQRLARGETARPVDMSSGDAAGDSGDVLGLKPSRLTLTFGFGPGLFGKNGADRYGLASRRPAALVDLPRFNGDQLVPSQTGGDLCVQACADDPQVTFHAIRQLAHLAYGRAAIRWVQNGFLRMPAAGGTPRNLLGFKDGTNNPDIHDAAAMDKVVWVGKEGPDWMQGGSYLVSRRIRMTLEHWDRMKVSFQEQIMGRKKYTGAPMGGAKEFDTPDLAATDKDGNHVIPDNAHIRLAAAANHNGAQILRRSYSYDSGANFYVERWPPWRQEVEFDAGLMFITYQRDPRNSFIPIQAALSVQDMMNQFITHVGSGIFACPGGVAPGQYIGQGLFKGLDA